MWGSGITGSCVCVGGGSPAVGQSGSLGARARVRGDKSNNIKRGSGGKVRLEWSSLDLVQGHPGRHHSYLAQ